MDNRNLNLIFKTDNGNYYYLNELRKEYYYVHPVMAYILLNNIDDSLYTLSYPIEIDGNQYTIEDFIYYSRKVSFLGKNEIVKDCCDNIFYDEVLPNDIEESIANSENIVFEMTENCNLKCVYCTYGELYNRTPFRGHKNLDIGFAIKLITYFHNNYWNTEKNHSLKKNIKISFYGGEPLLRFKDIKRIVEYTQNLNTDKVNYGYMMTSNGLLIDENIALFLAKYNFQLSISIDGDEYGNSYRVFPNGQSSYNQLIKNVDFLRDNHSKFFQENVIFMSVLHNRNSEDTINIFLRDRYNKIVAIGALNPDGVLPEKTQEFYQMTAFDYMKDGTSNKFQKELNTIIRCYHPYINSSIYDILLKRTMKRFPTGTCMPLNKKIFISARNLLLPCEKIDFRFNYGNLENVNDIEELINEVARKHSSYLNTISKNCRTCYINYICDKCVFYIIDSKKECYDTPQSCKHFCTKTDFQNKMGYYIGTIEREQSKLNESLYNCKKI